MREFYRLLDEYNAAPDADLADLEEKVWRNYGVEGLAFVLDMSGFSRLTQRHGILHYLTMVRRMQVAAGPVLQRFGGRIVKFEADNLFAFFEDAAKAVRAAASVNIALDAMNTMTPPEKDVFTSIGIASGRLLLVDGRDYFGAPVNLASKLGEDFAKPGEIIVSKEVADALADRGEHRFEPVTMTASGLNLTVYKVVY